MKRILIAALLALAIVLPTFAQEPAPAPAADAPKVDAAAPAPAADAAVAPVKLEGKIIVAKDAEGKETASIKTADAELALLPCDKLTELLKVEKVAEKTFVLEGEKAKDKDGKETGFMIKNFEEKKADAAAPVTEEKK